MGNQNCWLQIPEDSSRIPTAKVQQDRSTTLFPPHKEIEIFATLKFENSLSFSERFSVHRPLQHLHENHHMPTRYRGTKFDFGCPKVASVMLLRNHRIDE